MRASDRVRRGRRAILILVTLGAAGALGGCETSPATQTARLDVRAAIARGDIQSPKAAAMAVASIDGAPDAIATKLRQDMTVEAATRQITITDPAVARYLVRGYLDARPTDSGTSVHYVWDVFDASKHRMQRVDDAFDLPAAGGTDPWSGINDEVLSGIASRSTDDLALVLSKTPEALGPSDKTASAAPPDPPVN